MEDQLAMLTEDQVIDITNNQILLDRIRTREDRRGYLSNDHVIHNLNIRPCWFIREQARIDDYLKLFGLRYETVEREMRIRHHRTPRSCPKCRW